MSAISLDLSHRRLLSRSVPNHTITSSVQSLSTRKWRRCQIIDHFPNFIYRLYRIIGTNVCKVNKITITTSWGKMHDIAWTWKLRLLTRELKAILQATENKHRCVFSCHNLWSILTETNKSQTVMLYLAREMVLRDIVSEEGSQKMVCFLDRRHQPHRFMPPKLLFLAFTTVKIVWIIKYKFTLTQTQNQLLIRCHSFILIHKMFNERYVLFCFFANLSIF